jgi:hypothetical protein
MEQLVETMDLNEIAALLGISRSELVKRCRSLGIPVDGTGEDDESASFVGYWKPVS